MGVLKRKDERTETLTLRIPSSLKTQIDELRQRAEKAGFDLSATISEALSRLAKQIGAELDEIGAPHPKPDRAEGVHANGLTRGKGEISAASSSAGAGE